MKLRGSFQRFAVGLGLLVLVLVFAAQLAGPTSSSSRGALSVDPGGRRAALQLLQTSGHHVTPWRQAPAHLLGMEALLLVGERFDFWDETEAGGASQDVADGERARLDPRSAEHYLEFLETGGRAIVDVRNSAWLSRDLGIDVSTATHDAPYEFGALQMPSGEELEVDLSSAMGLPLEIEGLKGEHLIVDSDGVPFASIYSVQDGALVLVGDTDLWDNAKLAEGDHAYLLLALTGLVGGNRTVLFDDYVLGIHEPPGFVAMALRGRLAPFGWALLLWIALVTIATVWTWRFSRDPRQSDQVNAFSRVSANAHLLHRARGPAEVADRLRVGVIAQLARRLRMDADDEFAVAEAASECAPDPQDRDRWRVSLTRYQPSRQASLEEWARELKVIERAVEDSLRRDSTRGAGQASRTKHG